MSFTIHGLGTALPTSRITQAEALACTRVLAPASVGEASWLPAVYRHSEIRTRHQILGRPLIEDLLHGTRDSGSPFLPREPAGNLGPTTVERMRLYAEGAPPLAVTAAANALAESGFASDTITHLITVSCTGFAAPGVDLALISGLGLRPTVERTHVGFMGCHGALNGLRVANAFASADPSARILLACVELCSLHYYFGEEPERVVANAIFADGAAAVVGSGRGEGWKIRTSGSCLIPESADAMHWRVGDHGFEMGLSRRIPTLIAKHVRPWLEPWLGDNGLSLGDVGSWAIHPGGPKIVSAVEEALALPAGATTTSRSIYAEHGNMSSPTVLFVLDSLRRQNAARPCVALGFGPGLVAEAVLFE